MSPAAPRCGSPSGRGRGGCALDVDRQREATLAALRAERIEALAALDGTVQEAMLRSTAVIDHAVWRLAQLTAALLIGAALVVVAGRWRGRVGPVRR